MSWQDVTNKTLILHYYQQNTALPLRTDTTSQSRGHDDRQGELFWLDTLGEMDGRGFHLKEKIFYIIENGESGFKSTENKPSNN